MDIYEYYSWKYRRLHPQCIVRLAPFFAGFDLSAVKVQLMPPWFGSWGFRGRPTAVAVFGSTLYCIPGVLDADGEVRGNFWSWRDPKGIALWAHEVYHVQQWHRSKKVFLLQAASGLLQSLLHGQVYQHEYFVFEQEALAFEARVYQQLQHQEG